MLKKIVLVLVFNVIELLASFEEGKSLFESKCSSCHSSYIDMNVLKVNFFEKNNTLLNLKAPTVNMLAYAIIDSPKKIGDPNDLEMRSLEIEQYLKNYLQEPDIFNSICDEHILKFYDIKKSMKNVLSDEDFINLTTFFMEYKSNLDIQKKVLENKFDEEKILNQAKKLNKNILIYATSKTCYFCKKMEDKVLQKDIIKEKIEKDYYYLKVDVEYSALPFDLAKHYKNVTPTFFVLDYDGMFVKQYPGSFKEEDFLEILKENINEKNR